MRNGDVATLLVFMALVALVAWCIWLDAKRRQARLRATAELQNRLLEKFASPQDVAQFLQTEGGNRFLQGLTSDTRKTGRGILVAMQAGVIFGSLGLAAVVLGLVYPGNSNSNPGVILGSLILSLGAGFLIAAALSYRISKRWGILETGGTDDRSR